MPKKQSLFAPMTPGAQRAMLTQKADMPTRQIVKYAAVRGVIFAVLFVVLKTIFDAEPTPVVPNFILGFVVLGVGSFFIILLERKQARRALERIARDKKT